MPAAPSVSVGLPVFNGAAYVAEAIDSILNQKYEDFELVIQDNASTDQTEEICRAYVTKNSRVSYFRNLHNIGAASNYNLAFQRARGRYFKWIAHDDICSPDFLQTCANSLENTSSLVLCCGRVRLINDDGTPVRYDPIRKCYMTKYDEYVGIIDPEHRAEGSIPACRFWDILVRTMRTFEIFGLIR